MMKFKETFNPLNGPHAWRTGELVFGAPLDKTAYRVAMNNHGSLAANNKIVFPNYLRPHRCPIVVLLIGLSGKSRV